MTKNEQVGSGEPAGGADAEPGADAAAKDPQRRRFLGNVSRVAMTAGLVGGYGSFSLIAARYLYPARPADKMWQFVVEVDNIPLGESMAYEAPSGESISIVRRAAAGGSDDFIALSSTCPHLGCQVHWEEQNNRYFCPCHNGAFDPAGVATAGPPAEAGQSLPRYPLQVEGGLLYIEVPAARLVDRRGDAHGEPLVAGIEAPGHDLCLKPTNRFGGKKA